MEGKFVYMGLGEIDRILYYILRVKLIEKEKNKEKLNILIICICVYNVQRVTTRLFII